MLELLLITCIIVFLIDLSGAMDKLNKRVWNWFYKDIPYSGWTIPLFGCSLCLTWWTGFLYLLFTGFSIPMLAYVALLAFLTPVIKDILLYVREFLIYILGLLYELINQ